MHWYDWHTVTERLQGRAYALTRGRPYKVILDPTTQTGTCDFSSKRILINPNLFSDVFQSQGLSGEMLDKANFLICRAVTGHEALHVVYSDPEVVMQAALESAVLKTILNILEDARIEMIGSSQSHISKTLFRFVNGIARDQLPEFRDTSISDRFSVVHLLLRWRLGAHIPVLDPPAKQLWGQVLQLATRALYAKTCAEVLDFARQIVKLATLDAPDAQESRTEEEVSKVLEKMQSNMAGERDSKPLPSPTTSDSEATEEPLSPAPCNDPADDSTNDGHSPDNDGEYESGEPTDTQAANDDDASGTAASPKTNATGDLQRLVDETAMQVSEDLDTLVPQVSSDDNKLIAKSVAFRGRCYSDVVASPYAHYLSEAAPIAAELIRELKAESPRGSSGPSEFPGRFRTRYYVRDSAKPFSMQRFRGMSVPEMALSLVIDRSGSMEHIVYELRTMSMAIAMACEGLHIPLSIWALEGQVHIKHFDESGPQVLAKIAGIPADTLTRVMPTMRDAVADIRKRPEELKQIVLIHDGMPSDRLGFIAWRKELRNIGLFCLFIMRDEDYQAYKENPQQLRESMDDLIGPHCCAIAPVTGIAKHWCSFIRNIRSRHATPAS